MVWLVDDEGLKNNVVFLENGGIFVPLSKTYGFLIAASMSSLFLFIFENDALGLEGVACRAWVSNLDDMVAIRACACLLETRDGLLGMSVLCDAIACQIS